MDEEPRYPYGSAEYIDKIRRWKKVFDHHYKCNRHHPEHFLNGINDMNLVDMIEMLCDWVGYKNIMSIREAIKVVDTQMDRYGFSNDLRDIMKNTLIDYFSVLGGFNENQSKYNNTPIGLIEELGINEEKIKNRKEGDYEHYIDIYV